MSILFSNDVAEPESRYAWLRLAAALAAGTLACIGNWTVVVALPVVEQEFGTARAGASFPYACVMLGFAAGTLLMGRIVDRWGIVAPLLMSAGLTLVGYAAASVAGSLWQFSLLHFIIGVGASAGFGPLMADVSHWFTRNRGLAVVLAATGSYLAGMIGPQLFQMMMSAWGWRAAHLATGVAVAAALAPLCLVFRVRPAATASVATAPVRGPARVESAMSPRALQLLLFVAGFSCCVAMSMPQVHLVAYCGDLGYGVARGTDMLSLMFALGIVSRISSGWLADRFGGVAILLLGSFMQGVALFLYLLFDSLSSLFVITAVFGLFQGGIVPMYAVITREFLPAREAGARIGLVMMATMLGMAFGGWISGAIYDLTGSYRMAFLNGLIWNMLNLALAAWLFAGPRRTLRPAGGGGPERDDPIAEPR